MHLTVSYDSTGRLTRVTRTLARPLNKNEAIVVKCPRETYHMSSNEIKDSMRVKDEGHKTVVLEYGSR